MAIILGATAVCEDCGETCDADKPHTCTVVIQKAA